MKGNCRTSGGRDRLLSLENGDCPAYFDAPPLWTRPRGSKGAYLKEETKRNIFPLYSSLIRVIGAEQSASKGRRKFSEKGPKCQQRRHSAGCRHFGMFWTGRACTSSRALNKVSLGYCAPDRCVPTLDRITHGPHNAWESRPGKLG